MAIRLPFGDNLAGNAGGGFYSQFIHVPTIANSGFCRNTPDAIAGPYNDGGGNSLDYCAPAIPLRGACCINDECVVTAEDDCTDAGGTYQGDFTDFTDCTDETCEDACPADVNGDGQVNFADVIALIGAWGACP
ncbi:MAG: hypothetical protein GY715_18790 [Planctomycetes bacterium]|nr:hypothetical protein [Planctomycetota bacterium]